MTGGFFITGTDTNIGKTWTTLALMRMFQQRGLQVTGLKPVAAGCEWLDSAWKNQDALLLQQHASRFMDYAWVNPYAFAMPVSPHLACGDVDVKMEVLLQAYAELQKQSDVVLVEGAGGWLSPLSPELNNADLAIALQLPVIMVVGMRLGCINHARLTYQAIQLAAVECAGWVAVQIDADMQSLVGNLTYLQHCLDTPFLGFLPFSVVADFDYLAKHLVM